MGGGGSLVGHRWRATKESKSVYENVLYSASASAVCVCLSQQTLGRRRQRMQSAQTMMVAGAKATSDLLGQQTAAAATATGG